MSAEQQTPHSEVTDTATNPPDPNLKVKKKVPVRITRDDKWMIKDRKITDETFNERSLTIDDLVLHVHLPAGTPMQRDTTCDSKFMMKHVDEIGSSIRHAYKKIVPTDKPILLIMDNAGGHGQKDVKKDYETILKEKYNVIVHWQIANSPETNLLDLGAWMSLQCIVEKHHRLLVKDKDALAKTVESGFACLSEKVLTRIHRRWLKVLDLIIEDNGNNDKVESHQGLKTNPMIDDVLLSEMLESDSEDINEVQVDSSVAALK